MTQKDESTMTDMVEFHIRSAMTILDDILDHRTVDLDMVLDNLYTPMVNSEDEYEEKVWYYIRRYVDRD
tara:strand:+ start:3986 stop:4192 length:207 start_codon:yes stop_codon:yes gene_type:complete